MTVAASPVPPISYDGAGSPGPFAITWPFLDDTHITAVKTDADDITTVLVLTTDFTLEGAGDDAGGSLTLVVDLEEGETLEIGREVPINQLSEFNRNDPFPAETMERALDKLTMICQQIEAAIQNFDDAELIELVDLLIVNQDFIDLLEQLITNIYTETDYILNLGMLAYLIPIMSVAGTTATLDKTYNSALIKCTNAAPVTVTIRENDDTVAEDFKTGSFFSLKQTTIGGQVTLEVPALSTLTVPAGFLPKTRGLDSIITATCELGSADGSAWALSGDMAVDPASSVGSAVTALTSAAGVSNIDGSLGDYFTLTPTENITSITFSNLPDAGYAIRLRIRFTQHASAAKTVAWPAAFKWAGGTPGAVSTGTGAVDQIELTSYDQGTTWLASIDKAFA